MTLDEAKAMEGTEFIYMYCDDAKDLPAMHKYFHGKAIDILIRIEMMYPIGIVRTQEYVEQECRNLAEQLDCIKDTLLETRILLENKPAPDTAE